MNNFVKKAEWSAQLDDADMINFQLLEDFFNDKHPMPGSDKNGEPLIRNNMTSDEIIDSLAEMAELTKGFVYLYMKYSDYKVVTDHGKMKWQVYAERAAFND